MIQLNILKTYISKVKKDNPDIPEIYYAFYSNVIVINVFNNEAKLFHHSYDQKNNLDEIINHISQQ